MMKHFFYIIFFFLLVFLSACQKEDEILPENNDNFTGWDTLNSVGGLVFPNQEMLLRSIINSGDINRLKHLFSKIRNHENITIGFIGGSITQGAMATSYDRYYPAQLTTFLKKSFTETPFYMINQGIGSTDSYFGCCRIDDDILSEDPDIVVVEFSVNDQTADSTRTKGAMEGLLRKCLKTDAVVMMLVSKFKYDNIGPRLIHEGLGKYYNIPVISVGAAIDPLLQTSALAWDSLFVDEAHPNDLGHFLSAALLYKHLRNEYLRPVQESSMPPLPPYLYTDIYEKATIVKTEDLNNITFNSGWVQLTQEYDRIGFDAYLANATCTMNVKWREASILYLYSGDLNASMEVSLNGIPVDTIYNHRSDGGGSYMYRYSIFENVIPFSQTISFRNLTNEHFIINYLLYTP
jgi:hypothetical protein